jgi:hypothetical protein
MANHIRTEPRTSDAARDEIEQTRARMSETIDEIEGVLLRKKENLRSRLDVAARLKDNPLQVAAGAVAAGLLLGLLTGGGREQGDDPATRRRASIWENRARRLVAIARAQQEEIDQLEASLGDLIEADDEDEDDDDEIHAEPSRFAEVRSAPAERFEEVAATAARSLLKAVRRVS